MVKIDSKKLDALVRNSGLNRSEFSQSIGHSSTFIGKCIKNGRMSSSDIQLIRQVYETDVEYKEPKEPVIVKAEQMALEDVKLSSHRSKAYIYGILNNMENTREYVYQTSAGLNETERNTFLGLIDKAMNDVEAVLA